MRGYQSQVPIAGPSWLATHPMRQERFHAVLVGVELELSPVVSSSRSTSSRELHPDRDDGTHHHGQEGGEGGRAHADIFAVFAIGGKF